MARIQLRDTTIYIQDGLTGTGGSGIGAQVDDGTPPTSGATLTIKDVALNTDDVTLVPVGARFKIENEDQIGGLDVIHTVVTRDGPPTVTITFTPDLTTGIVDDDDITFLPQRLTVGIGDGDLSWTESRELIYDLDRDLLDTVRLGEEQPVDVELAFVFEYVRTESGKAITPVDAIKRINEASEWVSSAADLCEPYAVDIYAIHCVPCGTDQDQDFLFQDFRYEALDYSVQDASIAVSGRCNVTDVVLTRADLDECA